MKGFIMRTSSTARRVIAGATASAAAAAAAAVLLLAPTAADAGHTLRTTVIGQALDGHTLSSGLGHTL